MTFSCSSPSSATANDRRRLFFFFPARWFLLFLPGAGCSLGVAFNVGWSMGGEAVASRRPSPGAGALRIADSAIEPRLIS